jgi:hypothetical protein
MYLYLDHLMSKFKSTLTMDPILNDTHKVIWGELQI